MIRYKIIHPEEYSAKQVDEIIAALPAWRREECLRFKQRQGQMENALAYWLLSEMMGFQPDFVRGEHGKPEVNLNVNHNLNLNVNHNLNFNLSHCKRAVACVISDDGKVGIDVECLGRYKPQLAEYCMSDEELRQIAEANDPDGEFTLLWTRKEALLKMTGEGITDDMKNCLTSPRAEGVEIECGINKERGYAWSVASKIWQ
ncbi:MAG: 4'-phosphopantetheinyl transferase superfamily protein [Prevotella sp.]|nr:4'-phosphopantetheinyl transferase superfamily protein [Prevotella sp.]